MEATTYSPETDTWNNRALGADKLQGFVLSKLRDLEDVDLFED